MAYTNVSTAKYRSKLGSTLNESATSSTPMLNSSSFSHQQLLSMGWKPGQGLGKRKSGLSSHVSVKKRDDNLGLGMEGEERRQRQQGEEWWRDGLGDTLSRLSSSSNKKKKKSKKKTKDAKKRFTDEELFQATGGARFGMRAQVRAEAKWARTESSLSNEEQEQIKTKLEWNGVGDAKVLLGQEKDKGITAVVTEEETTEGEGSSSDNSNAKKKRKKDKKKKKKRKKTCEIASDDDKPRKKRKVQEEEQQQKQQQDNAKAKSKKDKKSSKKKKDKKKKQKENVLD